MSAFEDFVQLELPKRPYLNTDVAQESVLVRRGAGPRQLAGVTLTNGQVVGMVGGVVQGITLADGASFKKYVETVSSALATWTVIHNQGSTNFIAQVFDSDGKVIIPNEIETTDSNTVTVKLGTAATGSIRIIFLD